MISVKAIAAIALTGLGGITSTTAVYLEEHPAAFTHPTTGRDAATLQDAPRRTPLAAPIVQPYVEQGPVQIEPVLITGRLHRRAVVDNRAVLDAPPSNAPCSEWQDLATGPAGRRVRMLCVR